MAQGIRIVSGLTVAALLIALVSRSPASGTAQDNLRGDQGVESPVLPAAAIQRVLEAAKRQAGLDPLADGYRLLEELSTAHELGRDRYEDVVLTPKVMSLLARHGLRPQMRGFLGVSGGGGVQVISIQASRDNTLYQDPAGAFSNGVGPHMYAGRTGNFAGQLLRRGVLAFDVAGVLPPGAMVLGASLDVNVSAGSGGAQTVELRRLTQDWGEGTSDAGTPGGSGAPSTPGDATWIHSFFATTSWTSSGGDFSGTLSAGTTIDTSGPYSWSSAQLLADVQDMLDNAAGNHGWIIQGNEITPSTAKRIDTRENTTPANRPVLSLTFDGDDITGPDVAWVSPAQGTLLTPEVSTLLEWTANDASGIAFIDISASFDGGTTYLPVALGLAPGTTQFDWFPPYRPGPTIVRIEATDGVMNVGTAERMLRIDTLTGSRVPTTLRDFDLAGTQPLEHGLDLRDPSICQSCHGGYDTVAEPYFAWSGSMMANAARDPLFEACLSIAEQDAAGSGDLCIRCHTSKGWLEGRSVPTDASRILDSDRIGVSCDLCHRTVDPVYQPGVSPAEDQDILAALITPPVDGPSTGNYVIDTAGTRRGPFADAICDQVAHEFLASPFNQEAALCGTCHDVHNPAFVRDGNGNYPPGTLDEAAADQSAAALYPAERTYSEWLNSAYNTPSGVFAPEFGGNKDFVSTCQDCHMRDVTGQGCNPGFFPTAPLRTDLPSHDLTGGNTWMPTIIPLLYPGEVDPLAIQDVVTRARYMLRNAAELQAVVQGDQLKVTVTNQTGHKLPTGYPEGRRMWLNIRFLDTNGTLCGQSGAYDFDTGDLTRDPQVKVYEQEAGPDTDLAGLTGLPAEPSFHFVLSNRIYKDNRIPPRGFTNAAYDAFGGAPVDYTYADGQYWDDTYYSIPRCATSAEVTLYYQTTSKEYVEFLRDENVTDGTGQLMYDLWDQNGKCPPEVMARVLRFLPPVMVDSPSEIAPGRRAQK